MPTIAAGPVLDECLAALKRQTYDAFEVVVVDNRERNIGYGAAINRAAREHPADYIAALNDDAVPHERWLESLVAALDADPRAGMAASLVMVAGTGDVDSAGLLLARDGSSKQRKDRSRPAGGEVLAPSGSAALFRAELFRELGGFEESFFLYCEETDLALRAQRAGWRCLYEPEAVVQHRYSHSAGKASAVKAWYVERNRLRLAVRNLPASWVVLAPLASLVRYLWHAAALLGGRGAAGDYRKAGGSAWRLPWIVMKAHAAALVDLPALLRQRAAIAQTARLSPSEYASLLKRHSISLREVAEQ